MQEKLATARQLEKLQELDVQLPSNITLTMNEATVMIRDEMKERGLWNTPRITKVVDTALAVSSEWKD